MKKNKEILWTDDYGFSLTLEEMIEEIQYLRLMKVKYHFLLFKNKISVQEIANVETQIKNQLHPIIKPVLPVETKKPVIKRKQASKKITKKKKGS